MHAPSSLGNGINLLVHSIGLCICIVLGKRKQLIKTFVGMEIMLLNKAFYQQIQNNIDMCSSFSDGIKIVIFFRVVFLCRQKVNLLRANPFPCYSRPYFSGAIAWLKDCPVPFSYDLDRHNIVSRSQGRPRVRGRAPRSRQGSSTGEYNAQVRVGRHTDLLTLLCC